MMNHANVECFSLSVLDCVVDVLYCYWRKPPEYLYTPKGIHTHAHTEVHYAVGVYKAVNVESERVGLQPGEALLIAPNVLHTSTSEHCRDMTFVFNLHEPKNGLEALELKEKYRVVKGVNIAYIDDVRREYLQRLPGYQEKLKMLFPLSLIDLARQCGANFHHTVDPMTDQQYGLLIERYISICISEAGVGGEFMQSKEKLAAELNLSLRQLERIIKRVFNMSYRELCNKHKFELATHLLTDMNLKVKEVADFLSYSEEANFSRAFKNYFGVSPTMLSFSDANTGNLTQ
jgi:AraC-like DNA-binding protein